MKHHLEEVIEDFSRDMSENVSTSAALHLFVVNDTCTKLKKKKWEYSTVLWLSCCS